MRPTGSIPRILTASLLLSAARAAADGPYFSSSASAIWQDNVTNATPGDGVLGAFTLETGVDVRWLRSIDFSTILSSGLTATAGCCTTFGGLDSFAFGPGAGLEYAVTGNLWVRGQVDFLFTHYAGEIQRSPSLFAGVVYRP